MSHLVDAVSQPHLQRLVSNVSSHPPRADGRLP
jgi:hypothetical protein